jgi:hypothetical protein
MTVVALAPRLVLVITRHITVACSGRWARTFGVGGPLGAPAAAEAWR